MKGLREYIKRHGKHFTEELAYRAVGKKWTARQVEEATQKEVYYNVTQSTIGDMTFLMNFKGSFKSKRDAIKYTLSVVGDYNCTERPFLAWVVVFASIEDFDFTPYV